MKTQIAIAMLLATACLVAYSDEPIPKASLQVCNDAMRDYDAAVRGGNLEVTAAAKTRVLQECYTGSGRTPILQEPISIGPDRKADAPVKAAPTAPTIVIPSAPSILTTCDACGCWSISGTATTARAGL